MDWNRLLSRVRPGMGRRRNESEARTDFQRDFDRIVFSSAFRCLRDKTQVFPLAQNDYVRTRLIHSLEVSSVGRTLGNKVGESVIARHGLAGVYPQDFGAIVAAACLAHDIGNPPFGHAGEDAIRLWFRNSSTGQAVVAALPPAQRQDFLCFEGNAQGFRVITRLQSPDNRGGLQLTCATLGSFSKYPHAAVLSETVPAIVDFKKFGFFQDDESLFAEVAAELGLRAAAAGAWYRHPLAYLVEAADDICYRIVDIEDAFRLQQLPYREVRDLLLQLVGDSEIRLKLDAITGYGEKIEYLRAKAIGCMIDEVYGVFMANEEAILNGEFGAELLDVIPSATALRALKVRAEEKVYVAPNVVEIGVAGFDVLAGLLEVFVTAVNEVAERGERATSRSRMLMHLLPRPLPGSFPGGPDHDLYRRVLSVTDFVSGMTDSSAVTLFKRITGISLPMG